MRLSRATSLLSVLCVLWCHVDDAVCVPPWKACHNKIKTWLKSNATLVKKHPIKNKDTWPCLNGGQCEYAEPRDVKTLVNQLKMIFVEKKVVRCACTGGYAGQFCSDVTCTPNPCKNAGSCKIEGGPEPGVSCTCPATHSGQFCEEEGAASDGGSAAKRPCKKGKKLTGDVTCINGRCRKGTSLLTSVKKYIKDADDVGIKKNLTLMETEVKEMVREDKKAEVCQCEAGFSGHHCNQTCSPGLYGPYCSLRCGQCLNGASCHPASGACKKCEQGLNLPSCKGNPNYECEAGKNCVNGVCENKKKCSCSPGYVGQRCLKQCEKNTWGADCKNTCGKCLKGTCDHETGACEGGCEQGWRNSLCSSASTKVEARGGAQLNINPEIVLTDTSGNVITNEAEYLRLLRSEIENKMNEVYEEYGGLSPYRPNQNASFLTLASPIRKRRWRFLGVEAGEDIEHMTSPGAPPVDDASDRVVTRRVDEPYEKRQRGKTVKITKQASDIVDGMIKMMNKAADLTMGKASETTRYELDLDFSPASKVAKKRQAGGAALQSDFTMGFPQGSVDEGGLRQSLTENLKKASDEVQIAGVEVDRNSIGVRQVGVVSADDSEGPSMAMLGGLIAGVALLVGASMLALFSLNKKSKSQKKRVEAKPSRSRSKTTSRKSKSTTAKSVSTVSRSQRSVKSKHAKTMQSRV